LETASTDINGDIEFTNVNFVYPTRHDVPILRNLNLIARAGKTTALVGLSGCGEYYFYENTTCLVFLGP
jgi:ABC-type bacteriocin/lantibiotic exporter with double-glycine peptidase domain